MVVYKQRIYSSPTPIFPHDPRVKSGRGEFPIPRNLKAGSGVMQSLGKPTIPTSQHMLKAIFALFTVYEQI